MADAEADCASSEAASTYFIFSIRTCFRGGLVFEPHRLLYHSTLVLRVMKKKKKKKKVSGFGFRAQDLGFRV